MIYPLGGLLIGAVLGASMARIRGGRAADMAQWAAVMAILLGLAGLVILIAIDRSLQ